MGAARILGDALIKWFHLSGHATLKQQVAGDFLSSRVHYLDDVFIVCYPRLDNTLRSSEGVPALIEQLNDVVSSVVKLSALQARSIISLQINVS